MSRSAKMFNDQEARFEMPEPTTKNFDGIAAYERPLKEQYLQLLLTNTFGNTYYMDTKKLLDGSKELHAQMLTQDPEFVAKALAFARKVGYMQIQPIFGLVKLAAVRSDLMKQIFRQVIFTPADLKEFRNILAQENRGDGGRAIKSAVNDFLNDISSFHAIKYKSEVGNGADLKELIIRNHPKPKNNIVEGIFRFIMGHKQDSETLLPKQIVAYQNFLKAKGIDAQIAYIQEGRLPYEVVKGKVHSKEVVKALLPNMSIMTMMRGLNEFDKLGVFDDTDCRQIVKAKFTDPIAIRKSRIFPFQFLKAHEAVKQPWMKDLMKQALELAICNVEEIPGNTAIFLDKSGSMGPQYNNCMLESAIYAYALYKRTGDDSVLWAFDSGLYDLCPSKIDSVLTQAKSVVANGGTNMSQPIIRLMEERKKVDTIIAITDEQQNGLGGRPYTEYFTFAEALSRYRAHINPKVKTIILNVTPYKQAALPEDKNIWYIFGWSDQILKFVSYAAKGYGNLVSFVESGAAIEGPEEV